MSDDYRFDNNYYGKIVPIDDTDYYVQGEIRDPLTMHRETKDLLKCEKQELTGDRLEPEK